jgi:hypothetical protein
MILRDEYLHQARLATGNEELPPGRIGNTLARKLNHKGDHVMATPLTFYVPIKQDATSQAAAEQIYTSFATEVHSGLDASGIVHYARVALIPNLSGEGTLAVLLVTTFDGPMNPYLSYFWNDDPAIKGAFAGLAAIALNPPNPPVTDLTGFENFINNNNLNQPQDLYQAYPQTVKQIEGAFPQVAGAGSSA